MGRILAKAIIAWQQDQSGATAIEYGLICAGVALAIVGAVFAFGQDIDSLLSNLASHLDI